MWRHRIQWMRLNEADKCCPLQPRHHRPRHSSVKVRSRGLSIKWHKHFAADQPWCSYSAAAPVLISVPSSFFLLFVFFLIRWNSKWSWRLGWQVCLRETYHINIVELKKFSLVWHFFCGLHAVQSICGGLRLFKSLYCIYMEESASGNVDLYLASRLGCRCYCTQVPLISNALVYCPVNVDTFL